MLRPRRGLLCILVRARRIWWREYQFQQKMFTCREHLEHVLSAEMMIYVCALAVVLGHKVFRCIVEIISVAHL